MKIFILDDTQYILDILRAELAGHEVHTFTNPEKFIDSITQDIDVIISDLRVSRYDAINNIKKFKQSNLLTKIIVISAYFTEDILLSLIDCHIFKAVKKTHEYEWFKTVVEAVNK